MNFNSLGKLVIGGFSCDIRTGSEGKPFFRWRRIVVHKSAIVFDFVFDIVGCAICFTFIWKQNLIGICLKTFRNYLYHHQLNSLPIGLIKEKLKVCEDLLVQFGFGKFSSKL